MNERDLVACAAWKENKADFAAYLAAQPETPNSGNDEAASFINLYNATTIRWILTNDHMAACRRGRAVFQNSK